MGRPRTIAPDEETVTRTVRIPKSMFDRMVEEAEMTETTVSEVMREALAYDYGWRADIRYDNHETDHPTREFAEVNPETMTLGDFQAEVARHLLYEIRSDADIGEIDVSLMLDIMGVLGIQFCRGAGGSEGFFADMGIVMPHDQTVTNLKAEIGRLEAVLRGG